MRNRAGDVKVRFAMAARRRKRASAVNDCGRLWQQGIAAFSLIGEAIMRATLVSVAASNRRALAVQVILLAVQARRRAKGCLLAIMRSPSVVLADFR
jgi:hypothetical protein